MTNIILCDDNSSLLEKYKNILHDLSQKHDFDIMITTFFSGEHLLFHLADDPNQADIIFMDILMQDLNGIDTAKRLRMLGCHSEIIFLSSSAEFVFESFDVAPLQYIIKDSESELKKLEQVFLKSVRASSKKETEFFICSRGSQKKKIPIHRITYFELCNRIATVYYNDENFGFYSSANILLSTLDEKIFVRCHRSFIVNLKFIDTIQRNFIQLISGEEIPLGSTFSRDVKTQFANMLSGFSTLDE